MRPLPTLKAGCGRMDPARIQPRRRAAPLEHGGGGRRRCRAAPLIQVNGPSGQSGVSCRWQKMPRVSTELPGCTLVLRAARLPNLAARCGSPLEDAENEIDDAGGTGDRGLRRGGHGKCAGSAGQEQRLPQLPCRRHQEDGSFVQGHRRQVQGQGRRRGDARDGDHDCQGTPGRSRRRRTTSRPWSSGSSPCDVRLPRPAAKSAGSRH